MKTERAAWIAYCRGVNARVAGVMFTACPWCLPRSDQQRAQRAAWQHGWLDQAAIDDHLLGETYEHNKP